MSLGLNAWISQSIISFTENSCENTLARFHEKAWDKPLVGFSSGDDKLYDFYKRDIGSFYLTPKEFLEGTYPDRVFPAEEISVISWVLPHTEKTKEEQRKETLLPTERAALSRSDGEEFNRRIAEHLVSLLEKEGYPAVSPCCPRYGRFICRKSMRTHPTGPNDIRPMFAAWEPSASPIR